MKKLMIIVGVLLVASLLTSVACARAPSSTKEASIVPPTAPMPTPAPTPPERGKIQEGAYLTSTAEVLPAAEERMIIRTGDMSLVVKDVVGVLDKIAELTVNLEGYVVSTWVTGEEEEMRGIISFRVPDEKFEEALTELRNLAIRVESENTNSQDVTEEYIDLEARLRNAEATESQYLALLDKAEDVEDILKIYERLSQVRREIEQIRGQMNYLERTSSMSLITARLQPVVTTKPLVPARWNALEILKTATRGLVTFGQGLATVAIWLLLFLPIWGTALGIFFWRRWKRKAR